MEKLLSEDEIVEVLIESDDPKFRIDNLLHITFKKLDIFKVSKKGLIFIHGDEHTGMDHIKVRHSNTSRKLFEKNNTFDNPTKFNLAPVEYPFVADAIFTPSNLNNEKNRRPDIFDCYIGDFKHRDDKIFEYTLILYKSSCIVHTFFLSNNSKPYNKKIKLPLRQGWSSSRENLMSGLQEYSIKYFDLNNIVRFTILLRCLPAIRKECWNLVVHDRMGAPIFTHYLYEEDMTHKSTPVFRMAIMDFQDHFTIDTTIKRIVHGTYMFEKNFSRYSQYKYLALFGFMKAFLVAL